MGSFGRFLAGSVAVSLAIDSQAVSLAIDSQAVSLAITESRNTTSPPEPKFFVKFILGPEPDSRIRRKKLHTGHRSSQNRFFESLSNAPQSGDPATALGLKNKKIQFKKPPKKHQKSNPNQSKMDQKSIKNLPKSRSGGILEASWGGLGASWKHFGMSWEV